MVSAHHQRTPQNRRRGEFRREIGVDTPAVAGTPVAISTCVAVASRANESQDIVRRAEAFLNAHVGGAVSITQLSARIGVKPRRLRTAFRDVRGMSPRRCAVRTRLALVRRALTHPETEKTTVTAVATDYGFLELGRFAGTYKAVFGETPSATLRGARCATPSGRALPATSSAAIA
jgi:transcriptional regulator GlxA family with amidase domain